jgi:glyoxylase-like metal-dependent hydrolase (beta-lactamase superfamily II)
MASIAIAVALAGTLANAGAETLAGVQSPEAIGVDLATINQGQKVQLWHVQGRVYLLAGAGANVTVQVGDGGSVLVNGGTQQMGADVVAAVHRLSMAPIQYIIDTNADPDVVGGTNEVAQAGHVNTGQPGEPSGAAVVAQLRTLDRLSSARPSGAETPTDGYEEHWSFYNDEGVSLFHAPAAHSDGDTYVFFRRSDVISTGDLFDTDHYPVIETDKGGSLDGIINALNDIIELMIPRENEEGGTYLIPGRGRICDRTEISNYRDALTIIRARIGYYVSKHMTLEQVLAARPTLDYDGSYGVNDSTWSTRMFIETVYREAAAHPKHGPQS